MKKRFFSIALLTLSHFFFGSLMMSPASDHPPDLEYATIAAEDLLNKIESAQKFCLVDCRPAEEFNAGHIPGAVNVSIDSFRFGQDTAVKKSIDGIQRDERREIQFILVDSETGEEYMPKSKIRELISLLPQDKGREVVLYCRRPDCTRSPLAARWLVSLGYTKVCRFEGGWKEWSDKGFPIEDNTGLGNPRVRRLAENVLAVEHLYHSKGPLAGVNAGLILTGDSVVFIDSGMSIASANYLWQLAQNNMTGQIHLYLILSHSHSDHVFGMRIMKDKGAKVIAHTYAAEHLKGDEGQYLRFIIDMDSMTPEEGFRRYGPVILSEPDQYIEQDTCLTLGGEEVHLLATPGHTLDSICVYHPASRTLFAGDSVYEGMNPNTKFGGPEEWKTWISHLERLKTLDIKSIVPGHGKISGKEIIDQNIFFLKKEIEKTRDPERRCSH